MSDSGNDASRSRPADSITFTDSANVSWRVSERDSSRDPGRRADRCLIFSCPEAVRRVWKFPPTWRTLTNAELEALSLTR